MDLTIERGDNNDTNLTRPMLSEKKSEKTFVAFVVSSDPGRAAVANKKREEDRQEEGQKRDAFSIIGHSKCIVFF